MIESDLPAPGIGGKGHALRRLQATTISYLQINAPVYGGRHPSAVAVLAFLNAAIAAVSPLAGGGTPRNVVTFNGVPVTFNGQFVTYGATT